MKTRLFLIFGLIFILLATAIVPVSANNATLLASYADAQESTTCYEDTGTPFDVPIYLTGLTQDTQRWTIIQGGVDGPVRLTSQDVDAITPLPSPNGCWIVYLQGDFSTEDPFVFHLLDTTCAPDCAGLVLPEEMNDLTDLRWSSDSTRLTGWDGNNTWIIDIVAKTATAITSSNWNAFPAWSPDGDFIVISSDLVSANQSLSDDIQLIPIEGGDYINLTYNDDHNEEIRPRWSPTGTQLAYSTRNFSFDDANGSGFDLFVVDAEACLVEPTECLDTRQQLNDPEHVVIDYVWSPDGSQIAYVAGNIITYQDQVGAVWLVDVENGELTQLTDQLTDGFITWSPDSLLILFQRSTEEELSVYGMFVDGREEPQLIFNGFLATAQPTWTPHWYYWATNQ